LQLDIKVPENLSKYIVNQGSIALDGVSLTVGEINDANLVTVWLIPETLDRTNLAAKQPGELVNVEVDLIAKYVERLITKGDKS
jgi:riboflavin synthase